MYLILSPQEFNPVTLYYQSGDLPEAQGQTCMHFAMPIEKSERNLVIAHAKFYLKTTEELLKRLAMPSSSFEMARLGKQFLNNTNVAYEIQDALFRELIKKVQRSSGILSDLLNTPHYPREPIMRNGPQCAPTPLMPVSPQPIVPYTPPQAVLPTLAISVAQLAQSTVFFLANKMYPYLYQNATSTPLPALPLPAAPDYSVAVQKYRQNVLEKMDQLYEILERHKVSLITDLDSLAIADQKPSIKPRILQSTQQYTAALREMEMLFETMQEHFVHLKQAQEQQWAKILGLLHTPSKDPAVADEKGDRDFVVIHASSSPLLLGGDIDDPRLELLFLQRLRARGLHVYNVPGDGHCALYALFKDPKVLQHLRQIFYASYQGKNDGMPEHPADTLTREIKLTRELIADRVKVMLSTAEEGVRLAKKWEITESPQAQVVYLQRYKHRYPQENASEEQYQMLEECYWNTFVHGTGNLNVALSDYHLSALSSILERPILVYSMDYLPAVVKRNLLNPTEDPMPIEECAQQIPVEPKYACRMDDTHPLRLYHSHGHYQTMIRS